MVDARVDVDVDVGVDRPFSDEPSSDRPFSDEELAVLAMAADPDADVPADAIPLGDLLAAQLSAGGTDELLPDWYMPPPMGSGRLLYGWRRRIVLLIVASFVLINAYGLCSTYGHVGFG